jgi:hypothetical protein
MGQQSSEHRPRGIHVTEKRKTVEKIPGLLLDPLPTAPTTDARKAQELQQLFALVKESAMNLCETSSYIGKSKLKEELKIHGHMLQKTLDIIALYAKK